MASKNSSVELHITEEIIAAAKKGDSSHCMFAEAIRCAVPDATKVSVDLQTTRFSRPRTGKRYTFLTPRKAQVALINFDSGVEPEPFTLRLFNPQITAMGRHSSFARDFIDLELSEEAKTKKAAANQKRREKALVRQEALRKARIITDGNERTSGNITQVVGGKTPPLQVIKDGGGDNIPFSRRRVFGLRALKLEG